MELRIKNSLKGFHPSTQAKSLRISTEVRSKS